ncbi:HelD family protein [Actinomyces vulturis]|uniref:HelD family protein n=1 Tax=Actinomyces vulturis TaxID=1857645 RepID=UPI000B2675D5|nr:UvrD-helicase domain-containing protein [Actinomyces vulturis]
MTDTRVTSDNPHDDAESGASIRAQQIAHEQEQVTKAYGELDRQRASARRSLARIESRGSSGTHQARTERDAFAAHYANQITTLDSVEDRLVFGRMDMAPGFREPIVPVSDSPESAGRTPRTAQPTDEVTTHYVGRVGLHDERRKEVVVDWRAPLARGFYQATPTDPMGLVRRRHIATKDRTVVGIDDDLLDAESLNSDSEGIAASTLQGEGALFAAMSQARDGRMNDIVATIQAEQDAIVTSNPRGVLVVQGGPGTGKTAVALHRVAYLFYTERERLERSGVLMLGPSRTFLRYVEQVLPSLGETGVVSRTMGDLLPGIHATAMDSPAVAALKGDLAWIDIARNAVRLYQRIPDKPRPIILDGHTLWLTPDDVAQARSRARRGGKPHNQARSTFVLWLLERLTDQFAALTHQDASDPDTRAWIREDIRTCMDARREINLCWLPLSDQGLLERILSRPYVLEAVAPMLSAEQRQMLLRPAGSPLTTADIPLLDELGTLLGPLDDEQIKTEQALARTREAEVAYAAQAIEGQGLGNGMVSAEMLADRFADTGPVMTLAERAGSDRSWTYGHVVVDEAQELHPMGWRALVRRCPVRSMTIVGDLSQFSGPVAPSSWREALSAVASDSTPMRREVLTVCYRTPSTIMEAAESMMQALGAPPAYPVRSVRDLPQCLALTTFDAADDPDALRSVIRDELTRLDSLAGNNQGRLAVITSQMPPVAAELLQDSVLAEAMESEDGDLLRARLAVMTPTLSKGLEFDSVVLINPMEIARLSPGDAYVAMTRSTQRLHVISDEPVPGVIPPAIS